jgi:Tfp pilus assembly protein FimT
LTLIELLVVIGIIGIILTIAIPNFASMQQRQRIRAGAAAVAQDFKQIRERAIARGRRYYIARVDAQNYQVSDPDSNITIYRLGRTTGGALRFGVSTSYVGGVPPEANLAGAPADGFDFVPAGELILDSRGGANRGVVYITNDKEDFAIGVNNLGKIKVYHYANGGWN